MDDRDKRKSSEKNQKKNPRPLVRLNGPKDEWYDSYGHMLDKPGSPVSGATGPKAGNTKSSSPRENASSRPQKKTEGQGKKESARGKSLYASPAREPVQKKREKTPAQEKLPAHEKRIASRPARRKKSILNAVKVGIFVLLVLGTVLLIVFRNKDDENTVKTAFLTTGTIENSFHAKVNIIRDEYPVAAGYSGKLIAAVNEGDRAAVGTVIAYIVKPEYESDLNKLRELEDKITTAQSVSSYISASQSAELLSLNEKIQQLTYRLSEMAGAHNAIGTYSEVSRELESLFRMRNDVLMNTETADSYISQLKTEREAVLARLGNSMHEIKAQQAGVVSFYVGAGQSSSEQARTIAAYLSKKGETGNFLSESALSFGETEMRTYLGQTVSEADLIARITPDVTYYLTADISAVNYGSLQEGKKIQIKAAGREFSVDASVVELLKYGDKMYLLMKSSAGIAGTISKCVVDSDIIVDYSEGMKIPKRALSEWDSAGLTARLAIVRANYVSYVYVSVLAEDSEYAIINHSSNFRDPEAEGITSVRINDLYVVNYEKVTEGQVIGG